MLEEYDIDKLNPRPNPYAKGLSDKTRTTSKYTAEHSPLDGGEAHGKPNKKQKEDNSSNAIDD